MIPKIIHYCWLSDDPFPNNIKRCIDSWKQKLPKYELILWNFERFPRGKSKWVDQAFDNHKYAFAADYIRLYALYNYGGIYLDSDVEVIKSFDDLLHLPYFIGKENTPSGIEAATIGCEKGNNLIKDMLDYYEGKSFIKGDGTYEELPLPFIFRKCIEARYSYNSISNISDFDNNIEVINVFPVDWFSPKHWKTKELDISVNTFSVHHFAGSWVDKKEKTVSSNKNVIPYSDPHMPIFVIFMRYKHFIKTICRKYALNNKYFAKIFFRLYRKPLFRLNPSLIIYKSDYPSIRHLNKAITDCDIEFIKKEESKYEHLIKDFFPIMRITGTKIEIHHNSNNPYLVLTKEMCFNMFKKLKS